MEIFEIQLKKEKTRPYRLLAQLILLVNFLFFLMMAFYEASQPAVISAIVVGGITLLWLLVGSFSKPAMLQHWMTAMLTLVIAAHLFSGKWWAAAALVVLALLYQVAMRPLQVKVSAAHIEYPSVPKRIIPWSELNNLILKDGLLTVDFRNNRLAQLQVAEEWYNNSLNNEQAFNQFCATQLTAQTEAADI